MLVYTETCLWSAVGEVLSFSPQLNATSLAYCDDSRVSREIRFENLDKIWIRQVIVYQHCVITGEKKTASYLWIFGYTWLILILFLHYANL